MSDMSIFNSYVKLPEGNLPFCLKCHCQGLRLDPRMVIEHGFYENPPYMGLVNTMFDSQGIYPPVIKHGN